MSEYYYKILAIKNEDYNNLFRQVGLRVMNELFENLYHTSEVGLYLDKKTDILYYKNINGINSDIYWKNQCLKKYVPEDNFFAYYWLAEGYSRADLEDSDDYSFSEGKLKIHFETIVVPNDTELVKLFDSNNQEILSDEFCKQEIDYHLFDKFRDELRNS